MDAQQIRGAVQLAEQRVDAASRAVAVHLQEVPAHLLDDLHEAFDTHRQADRDRLVFELARHLPGIAPAIHALAQHIGEGHDTLERLGRCCRDD
jgi:hypothetical protein